MLLRIHESRHAQNEKGKKDKTLQSAIAKAMAYSQAVFDSLGVEHLTLYRGGKNKTLGSASPGTLVPMPNSRELTSFSVSPDTAYAFGEYRMKARVPVARVFLSPVTYPKLGGSGSGSGYDENEFLISGLAGEKVKRMPDTMSEYEAEKMKMAAELGPPAEFDQEDDDGWHEHMREVREKARKREAQKTASRRLVFLAQEHPEFRTAFLAEIVKEAEQEGDDKATAAQVQFALDLSKDKGKPHTEDELRRKTKGEISDLIEEMQKEPDASSPKQVSYALDLLKQVGRSSPDKGRLEKMPEAGVSKLIDELKAEVKKKTASMVAKIVTRRLTSA